MNEEDSRSWVASYVSRETLAAFDLYAQLLQKWQKAINLVSRNTVHQVYSRHIADSLQVFHARPETGSRWLDMGSGAGFPGLVCAIAAKDLQRPMKFTLIESDQRKASFLREVARCTETEVDVLAVRIEAAPPQNAEIISARALAPLRKLCELSHPHLAPGGIALFPKGRNHAVEQLDADREWKMSREIIPGDLDPESVVYRIGELARV